MFGLRYTGIQRAGAALLFVILILADPAVAQDASDREALEKLKAAEPIPMAEVAVQADRKSTRLNSSHYS